MAISAFINTSFGERRMCYIRINNIEASNHGAPATALLRAFLSREAFDSGAHYVMEKNIEFVADVSRPLWIQAYEHAKLRPEFEEVSDC